MSNWHVSSRRFLFLNGLVRQSNEDQSGDCAGYSIEPFYFVWRNEKERPLDDIPYVRGESKN